MGEASVDAVLGGAQTWAVAVGECVAAMRAMPEACVDAIGGVAGEAANDPAVVAVAPPPIVIYGLADPRDILDGLTTLSAVRYIGKTVDAARRYIKHLCPSQLEDAERNTYKSRWIRSLLRAGYKPFLYVFSEVSPDEDANDVERYWIRLARKVGARLTNGTDGGDGGSTHPPGWTMPVSTRIKISEAQRGRAWATDDPRRAQLREKQAGTIPWHATKLAIEANSRSWSVVDPNGAVHAVRNLRAFCQAHGLSPTKMYAVARRVENRQQHKGWLCQEVTP